MRLITPQGKILPAFLTMVRHTGLPVSEDISPAELNELLQREWFQKGLLRLQIGGEAPTSYQIALLRSIDEMDARPAPSARIRFNGALLLGASLARVRSRLGYLIEVYRQVALQAGMVFILGSERKLFPDKGESAAALVTPGELPFKPDWKPTVLPSTEIGMMRLVVEQSVLPESWRFTFVLTPDVTDKVQKRFRSANTSETIETWSKCPGLDLRSADSHYLVVSNQPFVDYQELIALRVLADYPLVHCHAIGPAANPALPYKTYLDNLAKQLFEEWKAWERTHPKP